MEVPISVAQARRIQQRHEAMRQAKERLDDVVHTILEGHGLEGADVLLELNREPPVLIVTTANEQNGTQPEPRREVTAAIGDT